MKIWTSVRNKLEILFSLGLVLGLGLRAMPWAGSWITDAHAAPSLPLITYDSNVHKRNEISVPPSSVRSLFVSCLTHFNVL